MRVLYYDCFSGISGDMNLGALLDLGVDAGNLVQELSKLKLDGEYELRIRKDLKKGIGGTKADVILKNAGHGHHHEYDHQDRHHHDNDHHGYGDHRDHEHDHSDHAHHHPDHGHDDHDRRHAHNGEGHHHHEHRGLKEIEQIINGSDLNERVKWRSLNMFLKVAEAEAKIHGKSLYEVHFHEVGAVDSIVDIVGAAICLEALKVDRVMASPIQVGGGFVQCDHGLFPVPAPATAEILKGIPIKFGLVPFETTTPTGAAILAANVDVFTDQLTGRIDKIGYGLGTKEFETPNVLRVYLMEAESKTEPDGPATQYMLETNIDDMNPELYGYVEEKLFEQGASDVFKTPIMMKKGRPAIKLNVLVSGKREKDVLEVIFKETTSIGVRKYSVDKIKLDREFVEVPTQYGAITVKCVFYDGQLIKYKAEYEECKRIASERNIPIAQVYRVVNKAFEELDHDEL
ncbi:hypothetical protein FHR92_003356 [Fontibacillus solani]|uniref:Pyridinium-3,5-bisthiocarboxylic acid mononucleotide nickel insertion protein n=1 Tax=Fontibacillus solani TaxID=1572857 RepID=A0A7W3SV87_9BACL|nr:nickel pincer cofactor biosynthesis protein LarC [Fontibacillus solani]MBA9086876.1 hypothetical protein [Fontibacillus solani]